MPAKSPEALFEKVLMCRSSSNLLMPHSVANITNVSQDLPFQDKVQLIVFTVDATIAIRLLTVKERQPITEVAATVTVNRWEVLPLPLRATVKPSL